MNKMNKTLLSLTMLAILTACGGGGGGGGGGNPPATAGGHSGHQSPGSSPAAPDAAGNHQAPASQKAAVMARFDACPITTSHNASGSAACLAGTYTGVDVFTSESCTIRIESNGSTKASRGGLSIEMQEPNIGPIYVKTTYLPTANTSPVGYTLNWIASRTEADYSDKRVALIFNDKLDERLTIEVSHIRGTGSTNSSINCGIQL